MTRPLFEQYKDALRRGHVAARGGRFDDALAAYTEAARLAPDRAAPHTSSATVLHRAGRRNDSLAAFERALAIAPDDEATLRARAAAFEDLGRLASAAADLEHLAEALDADGRRSDALTAARRAVDLAATSGRRSLVERLEVPEDETAPRERPSPIARHAATAPPRPAPARREAQPAEVPPAARTAVEFEAAEAPVPATEIEPAPPVEAPPAVEAATPGPASSSLLMDLYDAPVEDAAAEAYAAADAPIEELPEPPPIVDARMRAAFVEPDAGAELTESDDVAAITAPHPSPVPVFEAGGGVPAYSSEILIQLEPELPEGASIPWPAIDLPSAPPPPLVGPPPDPEVLQAEALALIDAGDPKAARNLLLTAVMVHRAAGRPDAALDVCLQLLALAPGDAHVHLAIAGLQLDRGWRTLATEKIQLLLRLTALTGDTQAEADAHALAAERLRDEPPSSFARA